MSYNLADVYDQEPTHFFAGLQYGVHCVPTRERSLEFGHLFTFKDIAGEQHPLDDERGVLLEYTAELFGRVDMVTKKDGGFLVRLVCPLQIGCRLVELHRLQYEALRTILGLDSAQEGGVVTSSWLSCDIEGAELPAAAGALYVYIDNNEEAGYDAFVGQNIVMFAYMQRIDTNLTCAESGNIYHLYSLVGFSSGHLADEGLPLLVEPYICDRLATDCIDDAQPHGFLLGFFHIMSLLPLEDFTLAEDPQTLANANIGDFTATRDGTGPDGTSLFSYKENSLGSEWLGSATRRGHIRTFTPSVFGMVESTVQSTHVHILRVVCPVDVSCKIKATYMKQVKILQEILISESTEGIPISSSWFKRGGHVAQDVDHAFYVELTDPEDEWELGTNSLVGEVLGIWVTLHRREIEIGSNIASFVSGSLLSFLTSRRIIMTSFTVLSAESLATAVGVLNGGERHESEASRTLNLKNQLQAIQSKEDPIQAQIYACVLCRLRSA
ncbi:hypothetical protein C8R43DRAFT_1123649 [Mycena crocata]|nr:hypothetical protein C8R43DRAFT_1123649 [Mycena crocata]